MQPHVIYPEKLHMNTLLGTKIPISHALPKLKNDSTNVVDKNGLLPAIAAFPVTSDMGERSEAIHI